MDGLEVDGGWWVVGGGLVRWLDWRADGGFWNHRTAPSLEGDNSSRQWQMYFRVRTRVWVRRR